MPQEITTSSNLPNAEITVPVEATPMQLLAAAMERGVELEQIEKLMELQQRYEAAMAKKAFVRALTAFKRNPPSVIKDKKASFDTRTGRTEYEYADLATVVNAIAGVLSNFGLSHSWSISQQDSRIAVTCQLLHEDGHSESVTLSGPVDDSGGKNAIQAIASTVTYLERYTLLGATGLAAGGQDLDGIIAATINEGQIAEIETRLADTNSDREKFLRWLGVDSVENIPASKFKQAQTALLQKVKP